MSEEEKIIDRVSMIDQWKTSGDVYTQDELNAIGELLDLYYKQQKEIEELRRLRNKLSIATAMALNGKQISVSQKTMNELNNMFQIEMKYRPLYDDYIFYAR